MAGHPRQNYVRGFSRLRGIETSSKSMQRSKPLRPRMALPKMTTGPSGKVPTSTKNLWRNGRSSTTELCTRLFATAWDRDFKQVNAKIEAVKTAHGLAEDDHWPVGQGPDEYKELMAEWQVIHDRIMYEAFRDCVG